MCTFANIICALGFNSEKNYFLLFVFFIQLYIHFVQYCLGILINV